MITFLIFGLVKLSINICTGGQPIIFRHAGRVCLLPPSPLKAAIIFKVAVLFWSKLKGFILHKVSNFSETNLYFMLKVPTRGHESGFSAAAPLAQKLHNYSLYTQLLTERTVIIGCAMTDHISCVKLLSEQRFPCDPC